MAAASFSATLRACARKISLAQSWAQLSLDLDKPTAVFNSDNKQEIGREGGEKRTFLLYSVQKKLF